MRIGVGTFALLAALLTGCAAPVFEVALTSADAEKRYAITAHDGREDKNLYLKAISLGGQVSMYALAPTPSLEKVLEARIQRAAIQGPEHSRSSQMIVAIEDVDLLNKVGFGTHDKLSCRIKSTVKSQGEPSGQGQTVRSSVQDLENLSPLIKTAALKILDACLDAHAADITRALITATDSQIKTSAR